MLAGPVSQARKLLKKFPGIADPGVDRILLFGGIAPLAAIPSNSHYVSGRIQDDVVPENYGAVYRAAQQTVEREVAAEFGARQRAYLLLKHHGQEICKRGKPRCGLCPLRNSCTFFLKGKNG